LKLDLASNVLENVLGKIVTIASGTSDILLSYYEGTKPLEVEKGSLSSPVTSADLAANQFILEQLISIFGQEQCSYLSEETHSGSQALPKDWVWIIDPLDGTKDFLQKTGEFAVHIALAHLGRPVVAVVAIPERHHLYCAAKNQGAYLQDKTGQIIPLQVSQGKSLSELALVTSRNHRDDRFQKLIELLPLGPKHYVGSVGAKIAALVQKQADVYISLSGKSAPKDWDFAAPELILTEAGGSFTYLDGSPLLYNRGDVSQWGALVASNGACHQELLETIKEILKQLD